MSDSESIEDLNDLVGGKNVISKANQYKKQAEAAQKHLEQMKKQKQEIKDSEDEEAEEDYYDEMEYGDELNDQEEREYKKEIQQKYELPKRSTRGARMNALVGQAKEEDDMFYMGIFGNADQEDDSFDSKDESEAKDSFDSDFGQSSANDDDGQASDQAEEDLRKRERKDKRKKVKFVKQKKVKEMKQEEVEKRRSTRLGDRGPDIPVQKVRNQNNLKKKQKVQAPKTGSIQQFQSVALQKQNWSTLLQKPQLTPMEMMQEAAFTELINKQSLAKLMQLENDNINDLLGKRQRFAPGEQIIKFKQKAGEKIKSEFWFAKNPKYYPKNLHTKLIDRPEIQGKSKNTVVKSLNGIIPVNATGSAANGPISINCTVTGAPAKYRDPLTGQPFANKEAFKIIREKFFQKEEEKFFLRMQVLGDMLQHKKDRLRRYVQQERNVDFPKQITEIVFKVKTADAPKEDANI